MRASATNAVRRGEDHADMDATLSLLTGDGDASKTSLRLEVNNIPPQAALAIMEHRAHLVVVLEGTAPQPDAHALRLRVVAQRGEGSVDQEAGAPNALLRRARGYIQSHSGDPELSPERVAAAMGVSRTRLYRSFRSEGGVADSIRRARLEAARAALQNAADRRRISEIAFASGFASDAQFSRAFRSAFAVSPSQLRRSRAADPDADAKASARDGHV